MDCDCSGGEIKYNFQISGFQERTAGDGAVSSTVDVTIGQLSSQWRLDVSPFASDKCEADFDPMCCDVGLSIRCLRTTAPWAFMKMLKIDCCIKNRPEFERTLKLQEDKVGPMGKLVWTGTLVPRPAISIFNILCSNSLSFSIRFLVPAIVLQNAVDGARSVSVEMSKLLGSEDLADVFILSSDQVRFAAHSPILFARSNLLQKPKAANGIKPESPKKPGGSEKMFVDETACASQKNSANTQNSVDSSSSFSSHSSGYYSEMEVKSCISSCCSPPLTAPSSPRLQQTPGKLQSAAKILAKPIPKELFRNRQGMRSPRNGIRNRTPNKAEHQGKLATPKSPLLQELQDKNSLRGQKGGISPLKKTNTPRQTSYIEGLAEDNFRNSSSTMCKTSDKDVVKSDSSGNYDVGCTGFQLSSGDCMSYSPAFQDIDVGEPFTSDMPSAVQEATTGMPTVKVNISSTVMRELLTWIYTGECDKLSSYTKPLLVAAIRHDVKSLSKAAQLTLASTLTPQSTPEVLLLAFKYGCDILYEAALNYAVGHAREVTLQDSWETIAKNHPSLLLEFSRRLVWGKTE